MQWCIVSNTNYRAYCAKNWQFSVWEVIVRTNNDLTVKNALTVGRNILTVIDWLPDKAIVYKSSFVDPRTKLLGSVTVTKRKVWNADR